MKLHSTKWSVRRHFLLFPDDRIHLHNVYVRILFKELTEILIIAVYTAALIDL